MFANCILFAIFLFYGYLCSETEKMALQCPEGYGIRTPNDRHTS